MKDLKIFYFPTCPYCKKAKQAVEELQEENPKYREIGINWINEHGRAVRLLLCADRFLR